MKKYVDYLISSIDGTPISGVSVLVNDAGTANASSIFSDDGTTALANPFTSEGDGSFFFFVANGLYDLEFTLAGFTFDDSDTENITMFDPLDGLATGTATAASVFFAGTGGAITQDNTNFQFNDAANQLRLAATGSSAGMLIGGDVVVIAAALDETAEMNLMLRSGFGVGVKSVLGRSLCLEGQLNGTAYGAL